MEQKSEFVTVVAWIFIIFSAIGLLVMAMEGAMFSMVPFDKIMAESAVRGGNPPPISPAFFKAVFGWVILATLLFQVWVLVSSIGLLLRKNWARISFIVYLILVLVWEGISVICGLLAMVGVHFIPATPELSMVAPFMQIFMGVFTLLTLAFMVLFGWILKKLLSENIRREFLKPADSPTTLAA